MDFFISILFLWLSSGTSSSHVYVFHSISFIHTHVHSVDLAHIEMHPKEKYNSSTWG